MANLTALFLLPVIAYLGLVFFLYAWLTVARTRAVNKGETTSSCFVLGKDEPLYVARITRNLANQFELPTVFYLLTVLLVVFDRVNLFDVCAAWVFLFGRIAHTLVQTLTDNVGLRGKVFTINFLAVVALAAHVALILFDSMNS